MNLTYPQACSVLRVFQSFYPTDRLDVYFTADLRAWFAGYERKLKNPNIVLQCNKKIKELPSLYNKLFAFTIYYPELTITLAETGQKHTIYGVYVEVSFPTWEIQVGRNIFSQAELEAGYTHSHVSGGQLGRMHSLCLGNGPINNLINQIQYYDEQKASISYENLIQSFVLQLETVLTTESRQGVPYISMNVLGKNKQPSLIALPNRFSDVLGIISFKVRSILRDFIAFYVPLRLDDFYYDGRNYQLSGSDNDFILRLTKVAKTYKNTRKKNYLFTEAYLINDYCFLPSKTKERNYHLPAKTGFNFKGHYLPCVLRQEEKNIPTVQILKPEYCALIYSFLLHLINSVYATTPLGSNCLYSRTHQTFTRLLKAI